MVPRIRFRPPIQMTVPTGAGSASSHPSAGTIVGVSASCSRPGCQQSPAATLTYDYGAQTATLEHLAAPHPMQYDLCATHTERLSVPRGWELVDRRVAAVVDIASRLAS